MKLKLLLIFFSFLFLFGLFVYQYQKYNDGRLHVVFCNVGQGDGIFIRTPNGSDIVIDAGPHSGGMTNCLARHMPLWDRTIEIAFATHPDADHISGFVQILKSYQVLSFNTSQKTTDTHVFAQIMSLIKEKQVPLHYLFTGDTYTIGSNTRLKTYWPTRAYVDSSNIDSDTNSFSLVQTLEYGKFKTLLTGDIESQILDSIFSGGVSVDIFKLPHHGSRTGVDSSTLDLIHAQLAVISVGVHNRYGHPHKQVIDELKKHNLKHLRTDEVGDIEVVTDGTAFKLFFRKN